VLALLAPGAAALSVARKKQIARTQFQNAQRMREALNGVPAKDRSRRDYQRVADAFRRVYYTAPTSSKADASVMAVAELLAEQGRQFDDEKSLTGAIGQYEFLRREYPGSKYRFEALFTIGQIYKDDLEDAQQATATFEEFLKRYPRHHLAQEARDAVAELEAAAARKEKETEKKPAQGEKKTRLLVTGVRHWSTPDYTRVAIDLEDEIQYESGRIPDPDRIFFDLEDTKLASVLVGKTFDVEDGFLRKIRVAQFQPGLVRVVLEVDNLSDYSSFLLPNPYRLIIDIHGRKPAKAMARTESPSREAKEAPKAPAREVAAAPAPEAKNAEPPKSKDERPADAASKEIPAPAAAAPEKVTDTAAAPPEPKAPPVKGKRAPPPPAAREARPTANGERSLIRTLGLKIGRIVVDAGHGGHDTGTLGPHGLQEKDLVLDVALRLGKLLQARMGAEVVYTRDDDTFVPLETRTAIANQEEADLFISIHANSSDDPSARGIETYYLNFTTARDALEVAARENAVSEKSIHELQDLVKKIALKEKIEESREFAADVQRSLYTSLAAKAPAIRDRGVKKAPFIVLIGANMPSILAEISFVSNPTDERKLQTPEYRQKIADALYKGVARYVSGLSGVKVAATKAPKKGGD
jgi:N-acetylmuramoyl-L-alanine amidase